MKKEKSIKELMTNAKKVLKGRIGQGSTEKFDSVLSKAIKPKKTKKG